MILPSRPLGVVASTQTIMLKNAIALAPDFTPDAVNWNSVDYDGIMGMCFVSSKQITGINQPIVLQLTYSLNCGGARQTGEIWYKISANGSNDDQYIDEGVVVSSFTKITPNGTLTVNNNDYVEFTVRPSANYAGCMIPSTITVINTSDSNTTLDTFSASGSG